MGGKWRWKRSGGGKSEDGSVDVEVCLGRGCLALERKMEEKKIRIRGMSPDVWEEKKQGTNMAGEGWAR